MEFLLIPIAIAVIYYLLRQNTARGLRTVRAYMFLYWIREGDTVEAANETVMRLNSETLQPIIIRAAHACYQEEYGGSQLQLIEAARKAGFTG